MNESLRPERREASEILRSTEPSWLLEKLDLDVEWPFSVTHRYLAHDDVLSSLDAWILQRVSVHCKILGFQRGGVTAQVFARAQSRQLEICWGSLRISFNAETTEKSLHEEVSTDEAVTSEPLPRRTDNTRRRQVPYQGRHVVRLA